MMGLRFRLVLVVAIAALLVASLGNGLISAQDSSALRTTAARAYLELQSVGRAPASSVDIIVASSPAEPGSSSSFLPLVQVPPPAPTVTPIPWTTITSHEFEGSFPGPGWEVASISSYHWAKSSCQSYEGSYSAWAVGETAGGTPGLNCGDPYPNNVDTWLVYGPFSLRDATAAELDFFTWLNTEWDGNVQHVYDYLWMGVSLDNSLFCGKSLMGDSRGWYHKTLDLGSLSCSDINLDTVLGKPEVWFAFRFYSNDSGSLPGGAFVDSVVLRKMTGTFRATGSSADLWVPTFISEKLVEMPVNSQRRGH